MLLPAASLRVRYIFEKYYRNKARDLAWALYAHAGAYFSDYAKFKGLQKHVYLYEFKKISEAYFIDIIKYKEYHITSKDFSEEIPTGEKWDDSIHGSRDGMYLNDAKRAAFLAKWLRVSTPVLVYPNKKNDGTELKQINITQGEGIWYASTSFTISFIINVVLQIDLAKLPRKVEQKSLKALFYHLRYRSYDERHFIMLFDSALWLSKKFAIKG